MDLDFQLQYFISFVECSLALLSELQFLHLHEMPNKLVHSYDGSNRTMCLHGGSNELMSCENPYTSMIPLRKFVVNFSIFVN